MCIPWPRPRGPRRIYRGYLLWAAYHRVLTEQVVVDDLGGGRRQPLRRQEGRAPEAASVAAGVAAGVATDVAATAAATAAPAARLAVRLEGLERVAAVQRGGLLALDVEARLAAPSLAGLERDFVTRFGRCGKNCIIQKGWGLGSLRLERWSRPEASSPRPGGSPAGSGPSAAGGGCRLARSWSPWRRSGGPRRP